MRLSVFIFNKAKRYRHFALFDEQGHCIAFKSCERMPTPGNWVHVKDINLAWLNRPLSGDDVKSLLSHHATDTSDHS